MPDRYLSILRQYWGYDSFRGIQQAIIESIGAGQDTLGLMPTGGGKSITFQVPALAQPGLCLVVTPLIALMKDQVQNLRARGILATAIHAGMTRQEIIIALENCIFGDYKFLYVSPERLDTELFRTKLSKMQVSFLTVDEAHCISQWGYDFRPSYLKIADIRALLPDVPVLALTATATPQVVDDIQQRLGFRRPNVFRMSFERKNLTYLVRKTEEKEAQLLHILQRQSGSAIVYTRNRQRTKELAELLQKEGIEATFYHAGLAYETRDLRQKQWQKDECRVMVATNAFGMGIDKPDVRVVIHADLPDSPEAYFQEAGRAGRDGRQAYAVVLTSKADQTLLKRRIHDTFPEKDYIREVYEDLNCFYQMAMGDGLGCTFDFDIEKFCRTFKHFPVGVDSALRLLTQAGYLEYHDRQDNASRVFITSRREDLYQLHGTDEACDQVLQMILRMYTGLFADYVSISEEAIAHNSGLSQQTVYEKLLALSRRRILDYIPRKTCPTITYTLERQETRRIVFPPAVYDERKRQYEERIQAMLNYVGMDDTCRSRQLLAYFGEEQAADCGRCDVCRERNKPHGPGTTNPDETARRLADLLRQEGPMPLRTAAEHLHLPSEDLRCGLDHLIAEEVISLQGETLRLTSPTPNEPSTYI
ncbi:MAG: ATP-dependent DNA helicase RecQ [Bacteroidaceae bacterium]